jgi:hypothetical protein
MIAAALLIEIEQAGGELWAEGDKLKFRGTPARLIPFIREQKAELLALLSAPPDDYAIEERAAIQEEQDLPPDRGWADVPGLSPEQHSAPMAPQPAPATVTCGQCARFQPGSTKMGIGRCLAAPNGLPPPGRQGDYKAAFPLARRHCPDYAGASS